MHASRSLRPVLAAQPLPQKPVLRFRPLDSDAWLEGQVEDLAADGFSFLSELPLEIGTELEIALPLAALSPLRIHRPTMHARVVARVLARWPDLRTAIVADFIDQPGEQLAGAA